MKEMLLDVVEKMFKDHIEKDIVDKVENGDWAKEVWRILNDNEILKIANSESLGGAGGDLDDLLSLYQLIGKYAVPIPFVETTLANYFLESLKLSISNNSLTYYLPQETLQLHDNDTISGTLSNVSWARHVKEILAFANHSNGLYAVHISLAEANISEGTNLASEPRDQVTFENIKILQKSNQIVTNEQIQFMHTLDTASKNALISGAIEKIFQLTVQFTKVRQQFGQPIHRFQLVQQHLALLAGEQALTTNSFKNMVAALLTERQQFEVAFTRIRLDEAIRVVTTSAHQVHAAIGVTYEHNLHHYSRRLWSWREEGLTVSYWKKVIANALLTTEYDDLWSLLTE